ncbi:flagellar protein FlaG [Thermobrachium celere]|uniref:Flagellar protein FlaG n=1 Tax=Thermobrachium celere DSM 8682 TaxID=941824 RepID=R7RPD6_9CLOT|nr:flagellar protein FlaG [Thermobrachium celere]CDF58027.1 flagellar protein FlaG [Thermobrachium celere DSM 8682]
MESLKIINNQLNLELYRTKNVGNPELEISLPIKNNQPENLNKNQLVDAVEKANKIFSESTHLKFEIHEKTNDVIVKIVNDDTGEVIKEIPPKKILDMVAKMCELAGVIVDEKR